MQTSPLDRNSELTLYEQLAERIVHLIKAGSLPECERVPSVRQLSQQMSVSVSTVLEAYRYLEDRGVIEARPQSGYFVCPQPNAAPRPPKTVGCRSAMELEIGELILRVRKQAERPDLVPFGIITPHPDFLPTAKLNRVLAQVVRRHPEASQSYDALEGFHDLRVQIARRALIAGCSLTPDEIVVTNGAQEAVHLALQAVTEPGDIVILESPAYFGFFEALESLHLRALELSTCPDDGICLVDLEEAISTQTIAACLLNPTFGNPLGHCMPSEKKALLVEMLAAARIPLIEDDVSGDLAFAAQRPKVAKAFDKDGGVLLCSSLSKTLAPGYRIGWVAAGRFQRRVERLKLSRTCATATPTQMAAAAYLAKGGFDHLLRGLRRTYRDLMLRTSRMVAKTFPDGTLMTCPQGGSALWVQLPNGIDSVELFEQATEAGVSLAPGPIFSASGQFRDCIRLNSAIPWSTRVEEALVRVGEISRSLM